MLKDNTPFVSVLMPVYNAEKFVYESVKSILEQTYQNWELIICNDGSKDGTAKEIEKITDPRVTIYHNESNKGVVFTRNFLFEKSKGELITFQDGDDISSPHRLAKQVAFFAAYPDYAAVGTDYIKIDAHNKKIGEMIFPKEEEKIKSWIGEWVPFCVATVMVKKEILSRYGNNNLFFEGIGGEDLYWMGRIAMKEKTSNISEFLYSYRLNPTSITETIGKTKMLICEEMINLLHREEATSIGVYEIRKTFQELKDQAVDNLVQRQLKMIHELNDNIDQILKSRTYKMAVFLRRLMLK